jgi:hypothetical protein
MSKSVKKIGRQSFGGWLAQSIVTVVARGVALGAFRWRYQLVPVFVAAAVLPAGWIAAIAARTAGWWPWTIGGYLVIAVCTGAWLRWGLERVYDRAYGGLVVVLAIAWTLAVAYRPSVGGLYGLWLLAWPLLGLGWWFSPAFRSARTLTWMRKRWESATELAGVAGAKLVGFRETPFGRVLTGLLPGDKTGSDLSRERLEHAFGTRAGGAKVVQDKSNVRRFELHITDVDPWAGTELTHPLMEALPLIDPQWAAGGSTDDELEEVA